MATTPYMNLSLPTPSVTAGPAWGSQLNAALTALDSHDHTSGYGRPIRAAALSIDADVAFGGFNATALRSVRLANQGAPLALGTDVGCLYESGGNLYFNSAAGQQVQVTAGAALNAASIGAIGGDYATSGASEFYTAASQTFSFWQAANKSANLDVGSVVIRQPGATSPFGVTLQSPAALAAAYALTLPAALPGSTLPLVLTASGLLQTATSLTLSAGLALPGGSIALTAAGLQALTKSGGILQIGTSDAQDVQFARAGTAQFTLTWDVGASLNVLRSAGGAITGLPTPLFSDWAATKGYIDGFGIKATGLLRCGSSGAVVVAPGSFNIASASYAGGVLTVNMSSSTNANYGIIVTINTAGASAVFNAVPVSNTQFQVNILQSTTGAAWTYGSLTNIAVLVTGAP